MLLSAVKSYFYSLLMVNNHALSLKMYSDPFNN